MFENLDNEWIKNFEESFKLYEDYYKDDIYFTNIHYMYINKHNIIEKISEDRFLLSSPNLISREEVLRILKKNTCYNNKQYTILSILKFNVNLEPTEIKNFLKNDNISDYNDIFLKPIKNIDAINFEKSINMFHDLNDIIFVFYEKTASNTNNVTKKIYLRNKININNNTNSNTTNNTNSNTINNRNRKTIRKQYKD